MNKEDYKKDEEQFRAFEKEEEEKKEKKKKEKELEKDKCIIC